MLALWLLFAGLAIARPQSTSQHILSESEVTESHANARKLHGKFLHITDIHPDPFFRTGSDPDGIHPCHRGDGRAGYFGAESSQCDSPISLINATFEWIKHNVRDEIDFIVWTGDSARHDNDELYPRTSKQVEQLNEFVVTKFEEVFSKPNTNHGRGSTNDFVIPIIPTYGNNDILPHNIFTPGPNRWTRKYLSIWKKFIPQEQRHSFARGGWFFTEVIPNKLAVFSLNTMYFFESNGAVDGCSDPDEPGFEHFEWLRIQLQFLRQRGMKAILTGHVPPARTDSKQNWDETCYQKYNLWLHQYRDVIVGNLYGHMNIDHFVIHDVRELTYKFKIPGIDDKMRGRDLHAREHLRPAAKSDYLSDLRNMWSNLPTPPKGFPYHSAESDIAEYTKDPKKKKELEAFLKNIGGPYAERFGLSLISPSVVPNFFPTLRIIDYNITGLEHHRPALQPTAPDKQEIYRYSEDELVDLPSPWFLADDYENDLSMEFDVQADKKRSKKKKKQRKPKPNFIIPEPPSKTDAPGPGYSPQTLSMLSWKQLYANLTRINEAVKADLDSTILSNNSVADVEARGASYSNHFAFEVAYDTRDDKVYKLKDLTMRSWLGMAEKMGRSIYDLPGLEIGAEDETVADKETDNDADADDNDESDVQDSDADVVDTQKKKKKKKKKGKKGKKDHGLKKNRLWHTFIRRAFVYTKGDKELEDEFG